MKDKEKIIEIEPFEIEDKSKPEKVKPLEISRKPQLRERYCAECKKKESKVDYEKDKDIDQLKLFLKSNSKYIKDLHFTKGFSLQAIFSEIEEKFNKRVSYRKWVAHKGTKHLQSHMKPELRDFVLFKTLKYSNWDDYNKNLLKLNSRARYTHGFTDKLKRDIKKRDGNRCKRCGRTTDLDVHHIDGDRFNNEPENLITICKECHRKERL